MKLKSLQRYHAVLTEPALIALESPHISENVSYLRNDDVEKKGLSVEELKNLKNDWEKAQWGGRSPQGHARIKPGTSVIIQYMDDGVCHIMASDSPDCKVVVGDTVVEHLKNVRPLGSRPEGSSPESAALAKAWSEKDQEGGLRFPKGDGAKKDLVRSNTAQALSKVISLN
jgi:hypothetical protein